MFGAYVAEIAEHFTLANPTRTASFAGFMLTAIEGSYIRGRAERSGRAFIEAGRWLAEQSRSKHRVTPAAGSDRAPPD